MSDVVTVTLGGMRISVRGLVGDERLAPGLELVGTFVDRPDGEKLVARQVLDAAGHLDLQLLVERAGGEEGHLLFAVARFEDPGLVVQLYVLERDPVTGAADEGAFLGVLHRFAADFVAGGRELPVETAALLGTVFGDGPVVEPVEKAIQHLKL